MRIYLAVVLLCGTLSCLSSVSSKSNEAFKHTNIILIGATGDLAEKYLWRSLFDLFSKHYVKGKHAFSIYGCSRKSPDAGREFMSEILLKVILCPPLDEDCKGRKMKFVEAIQYHQLKTEKHYEELALKINENTQSMYGLQGTPNSPEDGRLVYLSIPPAAYPKTAQMVHQYLRPKVGRPWFRVVIEKPFGDSFDGAKELMDKLKNSFTPNELYRIDHYLGKTIVQEILPFRYKNREQFEPLWNRHHIERVEVVMKEKIGVAGRTSFYNEVGVLRDVMQNHLTEMAVLVGMDLPEDSGKIREIIANKQDFLDNVEPLGDESTVVGQYTSYHLECLKELPDCDDPTTPTYAASVLAVNNDRWRGVPFILVSGKKLDEKFSYVRVVFRDDRYTLQQTSSKKSSGPRQVVFHISHGDLLSPSMITVSHTLPKPETKEGWTLQEATVLEPGSSEGRYYFGEAVDTSHRLTPQDERDAYSTLLDAVYQGYRHMFVDGQSLLLSWKIWDRVISAVERRQPRIYEGGNKKSSDPEVLDFIVHSNRALEYVRKEMMIHVPFSEGQTPSVSQSTDSFRGHKLQAGVTEDVIDGLVSDIITAAHQAVAERGTFHLVLPGGQTPVKVFQRLLLRPGSRDLPWEKTHIWQLDERCVSRDESASNFRLIHDQLLQHVAVPYLNIHPMPVDLSCEPCSRGDTGDDIYESAILRHVANSTFDFVLLGVGFDGHVASLFPNQTSLQETEKYVMYSEAGPDRVSPRRMTLAYPILNKARNTAVVILGEKKHKLVKRLNDADGSTDVNSYPIMGIAPSESAKMTWYIDNLALYGAQL